MFGNETKYMIDGWSMDAGVAVGCGWQAFVASVNVGCYYVVGIPLGCVLGFKYDLGAKVKSALN